MSSNQAGILYLIHNTLGGNDLVTLPQATLERLRNLRYLIAENPKNARSLLKAAETMVPIQSIRIERLDEHTPAGALDDLLAPVVSGMDAGLVSDAGCPGIADPGAPLVRIAHAKGIGVMPMTGPSSIVLALMASGLEGQRFAFHGYLPVGQEELTRRLALLESDSRRNAQTQIFIETPYRNERMLRLILKSLDASTLLCVASDLTQHSQSIATKSVGDWRQAELPDLNNRPTVFLILALKQQPGFSARPSNQGSRTSKGR
jgi:16S rRNA (cytidine1402-2'-O)-methyltransferase